jgi:hypothetical protein
MTRLQEEVSMQKYIFALLLSASVILGGGTARADTILGFTNRTTFGGNDSANWNQLGASGATIPNPFSANSSGGLHITGSFAVAGGTGQVLVQGTSFFGNFANGDFLISTTTNGNGPLTLAFNQGIIGAGAQIQEDFFGAFTAQLQAFNGSTLLGSFSEAGTSNNAGDNSAIFIGLKDLSGANITSLVFSVPTCAIPTCTDFDINRLSLDTRRVFEPGSFFLLSSALAFLLVMRRRLF